MFKAKKHKFLIKIQTTNIQGKCCNFYTEMSLVKHTTLHDDLKNMILHRHDATIHNRMNF